MDRVTRNGDDMIGTKVKLDNRIYDIVSSETSSTGHVLYRLESYNHVTFKYYKEIKNMSVASNYDLVYVNSKASWAKVLYKRQDGLYSVEIVDPKEKVLLRRSEFKRDFEITAKKVEPTGTLYNNIEMEELMDKQSDILLDLAGKQGTIMKLNYKKPDLSLVDISLVESASRGLMFGCIKYGRDDYKRGLDMDSNMASLLRHLYALKSGEHFDTESGLSHIDHIAARVQFLAYFNNKEDV